MDDTDTANDQTHNYTEMSSASLWLQTTLSFQNLMWKINMTHKQEISKLHENNKSNGPFLKFV